MTDLSLSRSQMLLLSGSANRPLAEEVAAHLGQPLCQVTLRRFADGELFVKIDENVRGPGRLHHPAHQPAGGEHDGAAAPHGRGQAGQRGAGHGGHSLLRVCPAGPEGPAAGGDQRQADGQHGLDGGRRPGAGDGFPPAPAPGVLRPAGGPPVRGAGLREPLPAEGAARPGDRGARRRLGQDGPRIRQAAQRVAGDHRQAAPLGQRRRGAQRGRRGPGEGLPHPGRHDRHRRHDGRGGHRAEAAGGARTCTAAPPTPCSPGRRWIG